MKRVIFALVALTLSANLAVAQGGGYITQRESAQGALFNRDIMSVADMGNLSQSPFQYGTARSMAMAGAITSLGADATSMMVNPAGLGMYRSNELSFTPMATIQRANTRGGKKYLKDGDEWLTMSNLALVFNLYESGNSRLISMNFGVGYNKVSDFNYNYSFRSMYNSSSIGNLFSRQLTSEGVRLDELFGNNNPDWDTMPSNIWGAVLGYKMGLTDQSYESSTGSPIWTSSCISPAASVDHYMSVLSEGGVGEYDFSIGANIDNTLYLGFTLGVQRVYQRLDLMYGEEYYDNDMGNNSSLIYSNYNQAVITSGSGVNLKVGATYRPTESLRVGVAYHSPTWYNLDREYQGALGSYFSSDGAEDFDSADSPLLQDFEMNRWKFNSPSRILFGGSYTFMNRALVSLDYQCDWYGGIKTRNVPQGVDESIYSGVSDIYKSVNTLRVGGEYKLTPSFALRGGYGVSSSMVGDDSYELLKIPTTDRISYYSMGLGFAPTRGFALDLTFMRQTTDYSSYALFYGDGAIEVGGGGDEYVPSVESARSKSFETSLKQNNIVLSMIFKM